jgi:hypothetical protein
MRKMQVPSFLSPIISATNAQLPHNVHLLLAAGADPNGVSRLGIADCSVRYIRGRHFQDDVTSFEACKPRVFVLANAEKPKQTPIHGSS